jgi:HEPN/Toprim N-terminal domain 1
MGTLIELRIGKLEIDWGKNRAFTDHRPLFQSGDLSKADYYYVDDNEQTISERKDAYCKPLKDVLPRLELLGHTLTAASAEYEVLREETGAGETLPFDQFLALIKKVDVDSVSAAYSDDYFLGEFFAEEMVPRIGLQECLITPAERHDFGVMMENFHPWSALRLLAERPANLDTPVIWNIADVVENEWRDISFFVPEVPEGNRFLLVTEGSSDAKVLRKALDLLRPAVSDFFYFVDMEEGYPFTGTGNLANFCRGLVSIGVLNNILVIFDNDAEGIYKSRQVQGLNLPHNMAVMVLPSLPELMHVETAGPNGKMHQDINGRAASIEAYLDLKWNAQQDPIVRWSSYQQQVDRYQGALVAKEHYVREFLALRADTSGYDFGKLNVVLDEVIAQCMEVVRKKNEGREIELYRED